MERKSVLRVSQIALAGAAFIWLVGFILYQIYHSMGSNYWLGFTFGLVSLAAAAAGVVFTGRINKSTEDISGIQVWYSLIYAVIAMVLNIIFASMPDNKYVTLFVIVNLIILLAYALLAYNANRYTNGTSARSEYAAGQIGSIVNISKELAVLISINQDAGVRQELMKLKEKVDYSNNVSQNLSQKNEEIFLQKLYIIHDAIAKGGTADIIKDKIKDAAMTWDVRNSSTM